MENFARLSNTDVFVFTKVVIRLVRVDMQLAVVDVDSFELSKLSPAGTLVAV